MKTVAIIVAGGRGKRMGHDLPKQYLALFNVPILARTLMKFERTPAISGIILVVPKDDIDYTKHAVVDEYRISKTIDIRAGGAERQDSVRNGLEAVDDEYDIIVIHDGIRPFVSEELIDLSIRGAAELGAVAIGVPVNDTVKFVRNDKTVKETPDRNNIWFAQTPQAFKRECIRAAYESAYRDGFYGTDDASLVERMGVRVNMIPGAYDNIKITTPEDLVLGEFILKKNG
jgi:2-C-methyl-D-erythritol 4-phosphate cytidylyltransferase